ncbi:uncharacterized protein [Rutidosis leptorrhynchoides]|uniref:uncharacterized protein n=1 Tax=Rutidosis leptorrhynchoides TaxID=125765 RepID=UPI003A99D353
MYLLNKGVLYTNSFLGPHLRCLNPTQAESIIREVHEGMCAMHSGHKTVASKIMRLGYYWPSMYRDASEVIRKCIKARLALCRKGWINELPNVLWEHRTTPKGETNETPFSLVYGSEAVIPTEINVPTMRIVSFDESSNSEELRENINLVEERREMAPIKEAINKQRIANYYNKCVKPLSFQLDDLVWRMNEASRVEDTGKLGPKWEGPYKVIGVSDTGAYRLASLDGRAIKCTWHAQTLKRCYI